MPAILTSPSSRLQFGHSLSGAPGPLSAGARLPATPKRWSPCFDHREGVGHVGEI
jgi:hypothetical protein